jgi:hypothetical protein
MPTQPAQPPSTPADAKAALVAAWDVASSQTAEIEQVGLPAPPGFVVWRVVGTSGCTALPALIPHAPPRVRRAYEVRVVSTLTGVCPTCWQTAWISANAPDPETRPAAYATLDVTIGVDHLRGCEGIFDDSMKRWIDPRALKAMGLDG